MHIHCSSSGQPIWLVEHMSKQLDAVLVAMATSYSDPELFARGQVVDAKEVSEALAKADPDTVEAVCLRILAKYNPYENTKYNRPADVPAPAAASEAEPLV